MATPFYLITMSRAFDVLFSSVNFDFFKTYPEKVEKGLHLALAQQMFTYSTMLFLKIKLFYY